MSGFAYFEDVGALGIVLGEVSQQDLAEPNHHGEMVVEFVQQGIVVDDPIGQLGITMISKRVYGKRKIGPSGLERTE